MGRSSQLLDGWIKGKGDHKYNPLLVGAKVISETSTGRKLWASEIPRLVRQQ